MSVRKVNQVQLRKNLEKKKGARIVSFIAETVPDMRKTGNPFIGKVKKVAHVNGVINWIYANAVNRQREREEKTPDFVPLRRSWGERLRGRPFVAHKGRLYLEVKVQKSVKHDYFIDGKLATEEQKAELKTFLTEKEEGTRQQLDRPVILRDYKLANIKQVSIDNQLLVVS